MRLSVRGLTEEDAPLLQRIGRLLDRVMAAPREGGE